MMKVKKEYNIIKNKFFYYFSNFRVITHKGICQVGLQHKYPRKLFYYGISYDNYWHHSNRIYTSLFSLITGMYKIHKEAISFNKKMELKGVYHPCNKS